MESTGTFAEAQSHVKQSQLRFTRSEFKRAPNDLTEADTRQRFMPMRGVVADPIA